MAQEGGNNDTARHSFNYGFLRPPKPLRVEYEKDPAKEWKLWIQQYEYFETAAQLTTKPEEIQIATFMTAIGQEAIEIFNTLPPIADDEHRTLATVKRQFETHFTPKVSVTFERFKFHKMLQGEDETIDELVTRLRIQAKLCDYGMLTDSLVRDQLIIGIINDDLRTNLLADDNTLDETIRKCQAAERAKKQVTQIQATGEKEVSAIKYKNQSVKNKNKAENKSADKNDEQKTYNCRRCGTKHGPRSCPAYKHTCKKCNKMNHYESVCRSSKSKQNVCEIEEDQCESEEELFIGRIETDNSHDKWVENISIGTEIYKIKLDTGAKCNVLPKKIVEKISVDIQPSQTKKLISFSKHKLEVIGEALVPCTIAGRKARVNFKIVNEWTDPILGAEACEKLNLVQRIYLTSTENSEIYKGLGCVKNFTYDIDLIDDPKFEVCPPRKIPYKIQGLVKSELDKMTKMGVIEPISEATPSVSPMVVVKQGNKIRLCIDPCYVNRNIIRRHHPMRTIEEIAANIHNSKYYTLLDCRRGFWQIPVTERTKKLLTFATPWGRYCCKRLPFGLASAPEVFQKIMQSLLGHLPNVEIAMDDILIHAATLKELRETTRKVLEILRENGLTLNKDKCLFEKTRIRFLGHVLTPGRMELDPEKVDAVLRLQSPVNKKQLQRVMGKFTYLSKFIQNFSDITEPLRVLLEGNTAWHWEKEQEEAFNTLKQKVSTAPVLRLYDVNKEVTLEVDASSTALGAALLQEGQPVAFASKSLTPAQKRYAQIEREALAVKFGCEKFHEYVWGKSLTIETDHKPLETIFKKPLHSAPPRLQNIRLKLLTYNPVVVYKSGAKMFLADPLSRDCTNVVEQDCQDEELHVQIVLSITEPKLERLVDATKRDETCQLLLQYIRDGWPVERPQVDPQVRDFWTFRDQLAEYEGLIFNSHKVLIPQALRYEMLNYIHEGHISYEKSVSRATDSVYWPGMRADIHNMVQKCSTCQTFQRNNVKETTGKRPVPSYPFEIVSTDLFHRGGTYIVLTDNYSGFIDFRKLEHSTAKEVIDFLKVTFSQHGIPRVLESDNGPPFSSGAFKAFSKDWQFHHQTSSPEHPRGNGVAEKAVSIIKNILKRCHRDGSDERLALLAFLNTPREDLGSPAQRLYSRRLRSRLPQSAARLRPEVVDDVSAKLRSIRQQQNSYANRGATTRSSLEVGDNVVMKTPYKEWKPATVTDIVHPRSVIVADPRGKQYRRNHCDLRKTVAVFPSSPSIPAAMSTTADAHADSTSPSTTLRETTEKPQSSPLGPKSPTESAGRITTRVGRVIRPVQRLNL